MKNLLIILAALVTLIVLQIHLIPCTEQNKCDDTHTNKGRTIYVEEFKGHSIWVADQKLTHDPDCQKCKENMKQLITETLDSIVDDRIVKLLAK